MLFIFMDSRLYWTEIHNQWHLPIMATCKYVQKTNTIRKATRQHQSRKIDMTALLSYWKDTMRFLCLAAMIIMRRHTLLTYLHVAIIGMCHWSWITAKVCMAWYVLTVHTRPHFSCNLQHWDSLTTLRSWLNRSVSLLLRSEPSQRRYLSLVSSPEHIQPQSASLRQMRMGHVSRSS